MAENLISWNSSYSVKNTDMDEQHKKLIDIINKLFSAFKEGKAQDILKEILDEMIEYANYHLNSEEKLLFKYNYPANEAHEVLHNEFRSKTEEIKKTILNNEEDAHYKLFDYLKNWWSNHILIEDMKYADFIEGKK